MTTSPALKRIEIDPEDFDWGDICDIYGNDYHIGDQFKICTWGAPMPDFDAELGPCTLLYFEVPDAGQETDYVYGRPKDPHEVGGWTHYKLRELTEHKGTRVPPSEVLRMIDAAQDGDPPEEWMTKARALVSELSGPSDTWSDTKATS